MRPRRACDVCYKRKIQCVIESIDNPCEWCSHHELACTFNRETQKKANNVQAIANDVQELLRRVSDLENSLRQIHSGAHLPSQATPGSIASTTPTTAQDSSVQGVTPSSITDQTTSRTLPSSLPSPSTVSTPSKPQSREIGDVARHLGQNWYHKGIPILSERGRDWIRSKTGQDACFDKFRLFGSKRSLPSLPLTNISFVELCRLPDRHDAQSALNSFFESSFRLFYPVLDRVLIEETMEVAYQILDSSSLTHAQVSARVCILAALAMIAQVIRPRDASRLPQSDKYAGQAQHLLGFVSREPSLESLQAALMLQIYRTSTGEWEDASTLHSVACRIVCSLGGHFYQPTRPEDPPDSSAECKSRHTRTLFLLSYIFDKEISLRSGQPPLLVEDYCDLTAPEGYACQYDGQLSSEQSSAFGHIPCLPGDLGLSHVKEKTCRLLYSPKAFTIDDTQLLLHIRHLDIDLENWRSSVPIKHRPKLSITPGIPLFDPEMDSLQRTRCLHLQLEYHYLVTAIHTTVRRCGAAFAEAPNLPDDLHSVFHSSSDLALEASRSTLTLLRDHIKLLEGEAFWRVAFYPPVAAMSLFMNILIHPVDPRVQVDLGIIASTMSIFQNASAQALTGDGMEYVQEMNNFVTELVRLGNCAIWQAKKKEAS